MNAFPHLAGKKVASAEKKLGPSEKKVIPLEMEIEKMEKEITGPQFTSGVILKITDAKPLPGRKIIKVEFIYFAELTLDTFDCLLARKSPKSP